MRVTDVHQLVPRPCTRPQKIAEVMPQVDVIIRCSMPTSPSPARTPGAQRAAWGYPIIKGAEQRRIPSRPAITELWVAHMEQRGIKALP